MTVREEQRERLRETIGWATKIRTKLGPVLAANGHRVHFRPSSKGVAMVGLLPDWPQRGKSGIRDLDGLARDCETMFATHCQGIEQGRVTGEKGLQSYLIREAQQHEGRLVPINEASKATDEPVELVFVTDEISLPVEGGKIVCDILALRCDGGRSTPVLLELKYDRLMARLIEQVDGYAKLIDDHRDLFAELYGALLGRPVAFDGPTEKWIVWPAVGEGPDPREEELAAKGIRVVGYVEQGEEYEMRVGRAAG